jgi:hypothetical protein
MALDLLIGLGYGADKVSVAEGAGTTAPQMVSAVATTSDKITVTFNQAMAFVGAKSVLVVGKWALEVQATSEPLQVLWVEKQSDTVVILHVPHQTAVGYAVEVNDVEDAYLQAIDTGNNSDTFLGIAKTYPTITGLKSFYGLDIGLQADDQPDWEPDVVPPYLDNEDPADLDTGVLKDKILTFDLLDLESAINLATVNISVEGSIAYQGSTDTFTAPYNGGGSGKSAIVGPPGGYNFTIQKTSNWTSSTNVEVRVVAEDAIGNPMDVTYNFDIEDWAGPIISANTPTGSGISKTTSIYFEADDEALGSGVDSATLAVDVDGANAIIGGVFQSGFSGTITPDGSGGYDVTINKTGDYPSYGSIAVDVSVDDNDGNTGVLSWSFDVEDYLGPHVIPLSPTSGQTEVDIASNIRVRITDEQEVVLNTVRIEVDQGGGFELVFDGSTPPYFIPGWDGPSSALTGSSTDRTIEVDKVGSFPTNQLITVKVIADDPDANPERL